MRELVNAGDIRREPGTGVGGHLVDRSRKSSEQMLETGAPRGGRPAEEDRHRPLWSTSPNQVADVLKRRPRPGAAPPRTVSAQRRARPPRDRSASRPAGLRPTSASRPSKTAKKARAAAEKVTPERPRHARAHQPPSAKQAAAKKKAAADEGRRQEGRRQEGHGQEDQAHDEEVLRQEGRHLSTRRGRPPPARYRARAPGTRPPTARRPRLPSRPGPSWWRAPRPTRRPAWSRPTSRSSLARPARAVRQPRRPEARGRAGPLRRRRRRAGVPSTPAPRPAASPTACSSTGRAHVYAVDVGHGQLDPRLRARPAGDACSSG